MKLRNKIQKCKDYKSLALLLFEMLPRETKDEYYYYIRTKLNEYETNEAIKKEDYISESIAEATNFIVSDSMETIRLAITSLSDATIKTKTKAQIVQYCKEKLEKALQRIHDNI